MSWASDRTRRKIMQANRSRDTRPELAIRRRLHRRGLRYYVDRPAVVGSRRRADVVFPGIRLAVFIDGCYWHGCPEHGPTVFKTNADYWTKKIADNCARDVETNKQLASAGWRVFRVWEHTDPDDAAEEIARIVTILRRDQGRLHL